MALSTHQIIRGRYRTLIALGRGGFGQVWLAEDLNLSNRRVAIKENLDHSPQGNASFRREAKLLASVTHPNLPDVIEWIEETNAQLFVMAYIEGKTLEELLSAQRRALAEADVLRWIDQVMAAVIYLHQQQPPLLHRDIKPANIRVTSQGNAVLVDFGIAKQSIGGGPSGSARLVTPGYAPMEQWDGTGTDERTDVYGLGATLYYALTGLVPTEAPLRAAGNPLMDVRMLNPHISKRTASVVTKAMAMLPADRYASVTEMRRALGGKGQPGRPNRLRIMVALLGSVFMMASISAGIVLSMGGMGQNERGKSNSLTSITAGTPTVMGPSTVATPINSQRTPSTPSNDANIIQESSTVPPPVPLRATSTVAATSILLPTVTFTPTSSFGAVTPSPTAAVVLNPPTVVVLPSATLSPFTAMPRPTSPPAPTLPPFTATPRPTSPPAPTLPPFTATPRPTSPPPPTSPSAPLPTSPPAPQPAPPPAPKPPAKPTPA